MADKAVSMTLKLTPDEHQALQQRATELERSMSWVIRKAVRREIGLEQPREPGAQGMMET
jgi:predicted transcriptional regulator